ncbi:MAG: WYL domain-containing protein [Candidatus Sericytochromatia bacterium]|nr:WYL domain-containing protein [Candidatus Tanganyikabacteria bacterium]
MPNAKRLDASDRLLAIAALVAEFPGMKVEELRESLAGLTGKDWGLATLFADLKRLRAAGLLAEGTQRDGYYPPGPAFSTHEARVLLGAMRTLAENLGSPLCTDRFRRISRRLARSRRLDLLSYPAEAVGNRAVLDTTDAEYVALVESLEEPIRIGQEIRITKVFHPWDAAPHKSATHRVVPVQLLFHDVAWYLLAEDAADGQFKVFRLDRLAKAIEATGAPARGAAEQLAAVREARALLDLAWGVMIPPRGTTKDSPDLVPVSVRFGPFAAQFIRESINRHPTQHTRKAGDDLVFSARLHPCSLQEFGRWVISWGPHAEVLAPPGLRTDVAGQLRQAAARYD